MFKFPRNEERFIPEISAPVYVEVVAENFYGRYQARDISLNGISIYVKNDFKGLDIDREVEMHITLPGQKSFKVLGLIRHQGLAATHYFGVQLTYLESHGKTLVKNFIDSLN